MRADIAIERNGDLHEDIKKYARKNNVTHPRAYAELLRYGITHLEKCDSVKE